MNGTRKNTIMHARKHASGTLLQCTERYCDALCCAVCAVRAVPVSTWQQGVFGPCGVASHQHHALTLLTVLKHLQGRQAGGWAGRQAGTMGVGRCVPARHGGAARTVGYSSSRATSSSSSSWRGCACVAKRRPVWGRLPAEMTWHGTITAEATPSHTAHPRPAHLLALAECAAGGRKL